MENSLRAGKRHYCLSCNLSSPFILLTWFGRALIVGSSVLLLMALCFDDTSTVIVGNIFSNWLSLNTWDVMNLCFSLFAYSFASGWMFCSVLFRGIFLSENFTTRATYSFVFSTAFNILFGVLAALHLTLGRFSYISFLVMLLIAYSVVSLKRNCSENRKQLQDFSMLILMVTLGLFYIIVPHVVSFPLPYYDPYNNLGNILQLARYGTFETPIPLFHLYFVNFIPTLSLLPTTNWWISSSIVLAYPTTSYVFMVRNARFDNSFGKLCYLFYFLGPSIVGLCFLLNPGSFDLFYPSKFDAMLRSEWYWSAQSNVIPRYLNALHMITLPNLFVFVGMLLKTKLSLLDIVVGLLLGFMSITYPVYALIITAVGITSIVWWRKDVHSKLLMITYGLGVGLGGLVLIFLLGNFWFSIVFPFLILSASTFIAILILVLRRKVNSRFRLRLGDHKILRSLYGASSHNILLIIIALCATFFIVISVIKGQMPGTYRLVIPRDMAPFAYGIYIQLVPDYLYMVIFGLVGLIALVALTLHWRRLLRELFPVVALALLSLAVSLTTEYLLLYDENRILIESLWLSVSLIAAYPLTTFIKNHKKQGIVILCAILLLHVPGNVGYQIYLGYFNQPVVNELTIADLQIISKLIGNDGRIVFIGIKQDDQVTIKGLTGVFTDIGLSNDILVELLLTSEWSPIHVLTCFAGLRYAIVSKEMLGKYDVMRRLKLLGFRFIYYGSNLSLAQLLDIRPHGGYASNFDKIGFKMNHDYMDIWSLIIAKGVIEVYGKIKIDELAFDQGFYEIYPRDNSLLVCGKTTTIINSYEQISIEGKVDFHDAYHRIYSGFTMLEYQLEGKVTIVLLYADETSGYYILEVESKV